VPNFWLVKTEPSTYSYDDLEREKTAVWDGVKNPVALRNVREMHPGDQVLVYHTGDEKAVVGWATVVSAPYADPNKKDPKLMVIDLRAHRRLPQAVTLAQIKSDRTFCRPAHCKTGAPVSESSDGAPVETSPTARRCGRLATLLSEFAVLRTRRGNAGRDAGDDCRAARGFQHFPGAAQRRLDATLPVIRLGAFLRFLQQPIGLSGSSLRPLPGRPGCLDRCCLEALGA